MNATIRHHIEPVQCPECATPMLITHRYESIHRATCGNELCKNYNIPFQQPYQDFELKPAILKHKEAHRG